MCAFCAHLFASFLMFIFKIYCKKYFLKIKFHCKTIKFYHQI
ncbi:hypothetical protein CHAB381_0808 [Campylobacter hominis ATCC BAA-381]|uniref:Uncharacterized protein n=1 Tax=Campylobacter hominis (strain ATCC BAA-381 / DSM 21671 / CCUG 45161 / LMG 19568 / NCTC 13146 / CH001A) TaxID=360107 RepID=A7I1I4_CAMHC|nr:hypothetical protein CHAB381_0808 [Campylobacter hominis ATCC BAA-381]